MRKMEIPNELVEEMRNIKDKFPEVFDDSEYIEVKWNFREDNFIFTLNRDNAIATVVK